MSSWYHTTLGRYNISDKWVGLDYGKLLRTDPKVAESILAHEAVHSVMHDETDFGQAASAVVKLLDDFKHLSDVEKKEIGLAITSSQKSVQEGMATLLQILHLSNLTSKNFALDWANKTLDGYYIKELQSLAFVLDLSQKYKNYFTKKVSYLSLENGARPAFPNLDLLRKPEDLKNYLLQDQNNPDARFKKIVQTLKNKPWIVTKTIREIAGESGIRYFEPSSKEECATFLTYLASFTNNPYVYSSEQIGDSPQGSESFIKAANNLIVGNMNLNLSNPTDVLFRIEDFLHYADKMAIVFVNPSGEMKNKDVIKKISGFNPEVNIAGFLRTGEKYLTVTSKEKATEILKNELKDVSMMIKWGGYNLQTGKVPWYEKIRKPDLIIYNNPQQMIENFSNFLNSHPKTRLKHLHAAAKYNHPLQTFFIKVLGQQPIHIVNTYGNRAITRLLGVIGHSSEVLSNEDLRASKRQINNIFSLWMNMHWDVDWVETMLDGKILIFRKG